MTHAIIDIGSNAIRAAVYEDYSIGAREIYRDRFTMDIQKLLNSHTPEPKHPFYIFIQHFLNIFQDFRVTRIDCVATEIFRNCESAKRLCEIIEQRYGLKIVILSGHEEARLTAQGLLLGVNNANGVLADLGGGSLELAEISEHSINAITSLPFGHKILLKNPMSRIDIKNKIKSDFCVDNSKVLYLIGGAFRIMGRNYMHDNNYPLKCLHGLEINSSELMHYLDQQNKPTITTVEAHAILMLEILIEIFGAEHIVISNYGLKEGVRFSSLSAEEKAKDVILARLTKIIGEDYQDFALKEYAAPVENLLISPDTITLDLVRLALMICKFAKNIDVNYVPHFLVNLVLNFEVPFNHRQRIMLALVVFTIYKTSPNYSLKEMSGKMLTRKDYINSQIIGSILYIFREINSIEMTHLGFSIQKDKNNKLRLETKCMLPYGVFTKAHKQIKYIEKILRADRL